VKDTVPLFPDPRGKAGQLYLRRRAGRQQVQDETAANPAWFPIGQSTQAARDWQQSCGSLCRWSLHIPTI